MQVKRNILAVTFLILILIGFVYTVINKQNNNDQLIKNPITIDIDMSGWSMYRNEKLGFEIRYPKHWEIVSSKEDEIPHVNMESEQKAVMRIFPNGEYDRGLPEVTQEEDVIINGYAASKKIWILGGGKQLVFISFYNWNPYNRIELETSSAEASEAEREEMDRILSTFKLTSVQ